MKRLNPKHKTRLLLAIAKDIESSAAVAHAGAKAASHHAAAGRADKALQHILEAEPALFDATKLVTLATYVKGVGMSEGDDG